MASDFNENSAGLPKLNGRAVRQMHARRSARVFFRNGVYVSTIAALLLAAPEKSMEMEILKKNQNTEEVQDKPAAIFDRIEHIRELAEISDEYVANQDSLMNWAKLVQQKDPEALELMEFWSQWDDYSDPAVWRTYKWPMGDLCDKLIEYMADSAGTEAKYGADMMQDVKSLGSYLMDPVGYKQAKIADNIESPLGNGRFELADIIMDAKAEFAQPGKRSMFGIPDFDKPGSVAQKTEYLALTYDYPVAKDLCSYLIDPEGFERAKQWDAGRAKELGRFFDDPDGYKQENPGLFQVRGSGKWSGNKELERVEVRDIRTKKEEMRSLQTHQDTDETGREQRKRWDELTDQQKYAYDRERWMYEHPGTYPNEALRRYVRREGKTPDLTKFEARKEFKPKTGPDHIFIVQEDKQNNVPNAKKPASPQQISGMNVRWGEIIEKERQEQQSQRQPERTKAFEIGEDVQNEAKSLLVAKAQKKMAEEKAAERARLMEERADAVKGWLKNNWMGLSMGILAGLASMYLGKKWLGGYKSRKEEKRAREVREMEEYEKWKAQRLKKWEDYKQRYKEEIVDLVRKIVDTSDYYYYKARLAPNIEETMRLMEVKNQRYHIPNGKLMGLAEQNPQDMPKELVYELGFGGVRVPMLRRLRGTHTPHAADTSHEAYVERANRVRENVTAEDREIFNRLRKYVTELYGGEP